MLKLSLCRLQAVCIMLKRFLRDIRSSSTAVTCGFFLQCKYSYCHGSKKPVGHVERSSHIVLSVTLFLLINDKDFSMHVAAAVSRNGLSDVLVECRHEFFNMQA